MAMANPSGGAITLRGLDEEHHRAKLEALPPLSSCTSRPHICFVAPEAWPVFSGDPDIEVIGGAELQQSLIARLLARAGYPVSMICLDYGQPRRVQQDGVAVHTAYRPDAGMPGLRFFHPRLSGMWQAMREVNADVYYQRSAAMLTAVVAAFCKWHGRQFIYAGASDSDFIPGRQQIRYARDRWLYTRGLAAVNRLVVQNETQRRHCKDNYGLETTLIPSCYDLPAESRPGSGRSILWVSTIRPNKRPELFLELARRLPTLHFVMVGGTSGDAGGDVYFNTIRRAAAALPNLEFTGFLPLAQVEPYFDRARIFVNTSVYEGMPNTFLQAWARGVPTVSFVDVGARRRGRPIYRAVYNVEEMEQEVVRLLSDGAYRSSVGSSCRQYFADTHSSAAVLAHYERLLGSFECRDGS